MLQERFDAIDHDPRPFINSTVWSIGLKTAEGWRWTVRHMAQELGVTESLIKHRIKASQLTEGKRYWIIRGQENISNARALPFPQGAVPKGVQSVYMLTAHAVAWLCESVRLRGPSRPPKIAVDFAMDDTDAPTSSLRPEPQAYAMRGAFSDDVVEENPNLVYSDGVCIGEVVPCAPKALDKEVEVAPAAAEPAPEKLDAFTLCLNAARAYRTACRKVSEAIEQRDLFNDAYSKACDVLSSRIREAVGPKDEFTKPKAESC